MSLALRKDEFDVIADFLKQRSGLALTQDKMYLIETRLQPIVRSHNLKDIPDLVAKLKSGAVPLALSTDITEAMTTNETSFFRDKSPFDDLKNHILPNLIEARKNIKTLRFWCAAASWATTFAVRSWEGSGPEPSPFTDGV